MKLKMIAAVLVSAFSTLTWSADFTPTRQYVKAVLAYYQQDSAKEIDKKTGKYIPIQAALSGSAVVIAPGYVLTAAHVMSHSGLDMFIRMSDTDVRYAKAIKIDKDVDLALLRASVECPCVSIASAMPSIDEPVVSVGFPYYLLYDTQFATEGRVQGYRGFQVISTATTAPGGSGGGLFVKEDGIWKVTGIVTNIASSPLEGLQGPGRQLHTWMQFSVGPKAIRSFLVGTPAAVK